MNNNINKFILKAPDSIRGRGAVSGRLFNKLHGIRNKDLRHIEPESQEYLLGELVGIGDGHLNMFPEVSKRLERAREFDWKTDLVAPSDNAKGYEIVNYGSFEGMYAALVEPWLGKYETLRAVVGKFERGEISREDGVGLIKLGKHGGDRRSESVSELQGSNRTLKRGETRAYTTARLRRDHPCLAEAVQRGELSANAAAIQAGFRKHLTKFDKIVKWLPLLSDEERQQLKDML